MTTATAVPCACCQTPRPAAGVYERVPRSGEYFCRDTTGCRRRMASLGDPVGEIVAAPPAAVAGATCSVCGITDPPGGAYQRTATTFVCLDRSGCEGRSVESQFLTAWSDSSPDRLISAADMRGIVSAGGARIPPDRTELGPDEMASLASQEALGRKRPVY